MSEEDSPPQSAKATLFGRQSHSVDVPEGTDSPRGMHAPQQISGFDNPELPPSGILSSTGPPPLQHNCSARGTEGTVQYWFNYACRLGQTYSVVPPADRCSSLRVA